MINKTGSAHWEGNLKEGGGTVSTQSGALKDQPYGFNTRFEDKPGTNPEELIGAAHASCFSMALALMLAEAGIGDVKIDTQSRISLEKGATGYVITKAHLTTTISGDADAAQLREIADQAKVGCPVSRLLNAEITMDATIN